MSNVATVLSLVSKAYPGTPPTSSTPMQSAQTIPIDGGQQSMNEMLFQILIELRITNELLNRALLGQPGENLDSLRADNLIEPTFVVQR